MKTNHTPGEWMTEYCGKDIIKVFKMSDKRRIATVKVKHMLMDEANAHLIAAAPELLAALSMLIDRLDQFGSVDIIRDEGPIDDARKAIQKAQGEA
jgi:hypothetical protein